MRDGVVNVTRLMQKWNTEILHFHCMFLTVQYFFGQALLLPTFEYLTDGFSPYNKFVYLYMQRKINLLHHIWNSFFLKKIFVTVKFCVDAELCCCSVLMLAHNLWWIRFQLFKKMSRFCCYSQSSWLNLNFFASFSLTFIINVRKMCAHTRLSMRFFFVFFRRYHMNARSTYATHVAKYNEIVSKKIWNIVSFYSADKFN